MSEGGFLENLPPEEKKRLAYIEGREDLFHTRVFEVEKEADTHVEDEKDVVVVSRDPGSGNALLPVVELLQREKDIKTTLITDGRAQEIFQSKLDLKDVTPEGNILQAAGTIGSPEVSLIDASEESGAEMFFSATFPEVPSVLVADSYSGSCFAYLNKLKDAKLPNPEKVCVIDEEAKKIIVQKFPELADAVEVTGQPAFDRFAREDTEKISREVKKDLGLKPDENLVTFMSSMETMEFVQQLAEQLSKIKGFKFTFRKHPRDNTPLEDYEIEFAAKGIDYIRTMDMITDRVGAASDLVISTISTEGLNAIYRRKPNISIVDPGVVKLGKEDLIPPSIELGASVGLDKIENLAETVKKLLEPESKENENLAKNMEKHYPKDGKNSERVLKVLKKILKSKS